MTFRANAHWYIPTESPFDSVVIENPTSLDVDIWTQGPVSDPKSAEEVNWTVSPRTLLRLSLTSQGFTPYMTIKAPEGNKLKVFVLFKDKNANYQKIPWPKESSDTVGLIPQAGFPSVGNLSVINLSAKDQNVQIAYKKDGVQHKQGLVLSAHDSTVLTWDSDPSEEIIIVGEHRLTAVFKPNKDWVELARPKHSKQVLQTDPNKTYFQVSNSTRTQSYVVGISDPALIQKARDIIADPEHQFDQIVSARLQWGHGGHNRDLSNSYLTPWSWSAEVLGFRSFGSTACNGTPDDVEDLLIPWMGEIGVICFWGYRVVRELSVSEITNP